MIRTQVDRESRTAGFDRRTFFKVFAALGLSLAARDSFAPPSSQPQWSRLPYFPDDGHSLVVINDVHYQRDSDERMPMDQSLERVAEVAQNLRGAPIEYVIQGGDLIQEEGNLDRNRQNYADAVATFQLFAAPVLHLIGNHDRWGLPENDIATILDAFQMMHQPYYVIEYADFQIVCLNPAFPEQSKQPGFLPSHVIQELAPIMAAKKTTVISHYDLFPQEMGGNNHFHLPKQTVKAAYANTHEIWKEWQYLPIEAAITFHAHWTQTSRLETPSELGEIQRVTLPSFTENMYGGKDHPGAYSIVSWLPDALLLQSYHQENCFSSIELPRHR